MKNYLFLLILRLHVVFPPLVVVCTIPGAAVRPHTPMSSPLYTSSRWIVNAQGVRVKLACINWVTHTEALVTEGLNKQPIDGICKSILSLGFNCVRLTFSDVLPNAPSLQSMAVEERLSRLRLFQSIEGIRVHNPQFLNLTILQSFQATIAHLEKNNVMVILDNHVSKPGWCCGRTDGNGFFGDRYFKPGLWQTALVKMAAMFRDARNVVGISLRNELRGPNATLDGWERYIPRAAEAVHKVNPNILVFISGLAFDNDLSFLKQRPLELSFERKVVYEVHRYGVSAGQMWVNGNPNEVCGTFRSGFMNNAGFLLQGKGYPLFLSEWGADLRGFVVNDNRFLNCVFGVIAELDMDWALWTLEGGYYLRQGVKNLEETYGIFDQNWTSLRNPGFMERVYAVQPPFRGPGLPAVAPYQIIFHPLTGHCVTKKPRSDALILTPCSETNEWTYNLEDRNLRLKGTPACVQAVKAGKAVKLGNCNSAASKWNIIAGSQMHLSNNLPSGASLCLDVFHDVVITRSCRCLSGSNLCDPATQWFQIVPTTRKLVTTTRKLLGV